ncbi:MAG: hypothetical protein WBD40_03550 [Tepidisphaeraceae bacterium]
MSDEIGPIPQSGKVVFYNPDAPTQVRQVTGSGSPSWVELSTPPVFAECAVALAQVGTSGNWFTELATGLDASHRYQFAFYASSATAFSDAFELMEYDPGVTTGGDNVTIEDEDVVIDG